MTFDSTYTPTCIHYFNVVLEYFHVILEKVIYLLLLLLFPQGQALRLFFLNELESI